MLSQEGGNDDKRYVFSRLGSGGSGHEGHSSSLDFPTEVPRSFSRTLSTTYPLERRTSLQFARTQEQLHQQEDEPDDSGAYSSSPTSRSASRSGVASQPTIAMILSQRQLERGLNQLVLERSEEPDRDSEDMDDVVSPESLCVLAPYGLGCCDPLPLERAS